MKRKLNFKFAGCLLAGIVLLCAGVHFLHAFQVNRKADTLLLQADREEADGDLDLAVEHLERYLSLTQHDLSAPTRIKAQVRHALLLNRIATNKRSSKVRVDAFLAMHEALLRDPENRDLRTELVRTAIDLRRFGDAEAHLDTLMKPPPDDKAQLGELERLLGRCEESKREYNKAAALYKKAIQHDPSLISAYKALAYMQDGGMQQPQKAEETLAALVRANPQSLDAWLGRCSYYVGRIRTAAAAGHKAEKDAAVAHVVHDTAEARKLAPDDVDVLLTATQLAEFQGNRDAARAELDHATAKHPKDIRVYLARSILERGARQPEAAVACLRKGLEALPDNIDLLWTLADVVIELNPPAEHLKEATEMIRRLSDLASLSAPVDYLQAKLLFRQGRWAETISLLDNARGSLDPWPDLSKQATLMLATAHERLGDSQEAFEAYRRAVELDPVWPQACLGLARGMTARGRYDDAVALYRRVQAVLPEARIMACRLIVLKNARLPASQRNWDDFDEMLKEAAAQAPKSVDVILLKADRLAGQPGGVEQAIRQMTAARDAQPKEPRFWTALASLTQQTAGGAPKALAILDDAQKTLGDRLELRLERAGIWGKRGGPEAHQALAALSADRDRFSGSDRERLLDVLASSFMRIGDRTAAQQLWAEQAALEPANRDIRFRILDLGMQANDEATIRRVLSEFQSTEGTDGTASVYARLCYRIWRASNGHREDLDEARSLLGTMMARRPDWFRVPVCEGRIRELEDNPDEAIKCYQRAIELGGRDPGVIRRAVALLHQRQRFAEAEAIVRLMPDALFSDHEMQQTLVDIALRAHDTQRALEVAEKMVAGNTSRDYRDYLVYAQALWSSDSRRREAEPAIRRAVALDPKQAEPWVALVRYFVGSGHAEEGRAAVHEAEKNAAPEQAEFMLAQCYVALRDAAEAKKHFDKLIAAPGDDAAVLRAAAEFYNATGRPEDCRKALQRLIASGKPSAPDTAWARRTLALMLAAGGKPQERRELEEVYPNTVVSPSDSVDDRRTKAYLLADRNDRHDRQQAIAVLEDLRAHWQPSLQDRYVLARLYETTGDWDKARVEIGGLLAAGDASPGRLLQCGRSLLAHGEAGEARRCLEVINRSRAGDSAAVELEARLDKAKGDDAGTVRVIDTFVGNDNDRAGKGAELLEELGELPGAEALYRKYAADPKAPERVLALANFLGRHGRSREALALCDRAWDTCGAARVVTSIASILLTAGDDGIRLAEAVEPRLQAALQKTPRDAGLLLGLATLRQVEHHYAEATDVFRQVIDLARSLHQADPHNAEALANLTVAENNLAWILALNEGRGQEALPLVDEVISLVGPVPAVLDTRAVINLTVGQNAAALDDLQNAVLDKPTAAMYFHLARAYFAAQNRAAAVDAWKKGQALGLTADSLDALERPAYRELAAKLGQK